ncbi:MAG TPA: UDP-glucuronic acid decarboxylase family protein [Ktedonobacteraceae bacterium]|jgi:dTDP-glucose 4,6-dehydratase|nr:UDP-glucuronic acid decarboxylase family protein [Ktedonobacteraceae bacterium]
MRFLITGGAGFVGSHFCDRLLAEGHEVISLDNLITGSRENIAHLQDNTHFSQIQHDISRPIRISQKLDVVLHFASPASPNPDSPYGYPQLPIQTLKVGALGTHNALGIARAHQARFLLASTSEIYGDPLVHPQPETYVGNVDPIGPRSMYDEAKRFAEAMVMAYHRSHQLDTRIVRIFNTYGPRMKFDDGRVIPNFIRQAVENQALTIHGEGNQTRSFCYIDDLIEGMYRLVFAEQIHQPVNIGNPVETTMLELGELINQLTGNQAGLLRKAVDRVPTDPERRRPDITRAKEWLHWEPSVSLETGLLRTIADFKARLLLTPHV